MDWNANIETGRSTVQKLLDKSRIRFYKGVMPEIPETPGIYLFSEVGDPEHYYYAGKSKIGNRGLRGRMDDHWSNQTPGDLLIKVMEKHGWSNTPPNRDKARKWIAEHISIGWLTENEVGMELKFAENFVIGVLQPEFNRQ